MQAKLLIQLRSMCVCQAAAAAAVAHAAAWRTQGAHVTAEAVVRQAAAAAAVAATCFLSPHLDAPALLHQQVG